MTVSPAVFTTVIDLSGRYSDLLVENHGNFYTPHVFITPAGGGWVTLLEFREDIWCWCVIDFLWFDVNWKFCKSYISHRAETHNTRLSAHPTKKACWIGGKLWNRKHGFEKGRGLHALSRSLFHEVCPIRDCSAPVVPRQQENSGAANAILLYQLFLVQDHRSHTVT